MKENQSICIVGNRSVLVPYGKHHVLKYHDWMQDPDLQKLTASEALSLDEEYSMQQSWSNDKDKCTFIVLHKIATEVDVILKDEVSFMAGDVNLFINSNGNLAEIEVMIAEPKFRGVGLGKEVVSLMILYASSALGINHFEAKIGLENVASLKMFENIFEFELKEESKVFNERTLKIVVDNDYKNKLSDIAGNFIINQYTFHSL